MSLRTEILEIVREMPGSSASEIGQLMSHARYSSITCALAGMKTRGDVTTQKEKGETTRYFIGNGTPAPPRRKAKAPQVSEAGSLVRELEIRISELEAWKAYALDLFPDLAVSELVLRARKIAAEHVQPDQRLDVLSGKRDQNAIIKAVVAALENA